MITYLKVRNLAIVEEFAIEPGAGLNVLTGETGAGKSLLIDSLELLRGARGSSEIIRAGAERLSAECVLQLPPAACAALEAIGVEVESSDGEVELIVKREIAAGGKSRVLMNGSPVPVRELATAMESFLEIHGQQQSHDRVAGQTPRELLDAWGNHASLLDAVHAAWDGWQVVSRELEQLRGAQRDRELRLDLLRYQQSEIGAAKLTPGEEDSLRTEKAMLAHARELADATTAAFALLEEEETAASSQIARAVHLLQPLSRHIDEVKSVSDDLQDLLYRVQELSRTIAAIRDGIRDDPRRLDEVQERLATVDRLTRKYGGSIEAVLDHLSRIDDEAERLTDYESSLAKMTAAEAARLADYIASAKALSHSRREAARTFEQAIQSELRDLAMERTTVRVAVSSEETDDPAHRSGFGPHGIDRVEILVAPNRGEEPKPMQRIASGGELSRIHLAIAAALFRNSPHAATTTLVFDEIDAGIGGRVAEVVGRKLRDLASDNQVICVTHLPQIAAFGMTHFHVWKEDSGSHTVARIRRLEDEEARVSEIARMLAGENVTATAMKHARELIDAARKGGGHAATHDRATPRRR